MQMRGGFLSTRVFGVVLWAFALAYLFPIFWIVTTSFKTKLDAFSIPPAWLFEPTLENYQQAFTFMPFTRYLLNSLVVAAASTTLSLVVGTMAAYALTRFRFRGRTFVARSLFTARMLPATATVVPMFLFFKGAGLLDNPLALVMAHTSYNIALVSWMMIGFLAEIPRELEEAAMTDGSTRFTAFLRVVLPLITPGLAASAVFAFISSWNDFVYALIFMSRNLTLPVGIATSVTEVGVRWGEVSASATLVMLPVLVITFVAGRFMVRGLTLGAVKG